MADQGKDDQERLHIVMFPWLAFGHLIPFLELSKGLVQNGHRISFITTPRNIQRLPKISPNLLSHFNFVSIPLPQIPNLPPEAEATIDLPLEQVPYLKKAYDALEGPLSNFLETCTTPDWIIQDFASYWLPPITCRLGIPSVYFSIFNASFNVFLGRPLEAVSLRAKPEQFTSPPDWIPFPNNLAFRPHEMLRLFANIDQNISGVTDIFRVAATVQGCDVVAIRSCMELESERFHLLERDLFQKQVIPVGLLPPDHHVHGDNNNKNEDQWMVINEWLEKQDKKSVVYVALGTEVELSREEIIELALGLELSELPFFWVLSKRMVIGSSAVDQSDLLPTGFQDRTNGRGFLCMGWAPQARILGHPSVGGFLTHCGWSSVVEALGFGCPLILLPFLHDQALIARLMVWKKVGLEIERDEKNGSFKRESIVKSLRKVTVEEEGESYRVKAREMRNVFGDMALHDRYIEDFAHLLLEHRRTGRGRHRGTTNIEEKIDHQVSTEMER